MHHGLEIASRRRAVVLAACSVFQAAAVPGERGFRKRFETEAGD